MTQTAHSGQLVTVRLLKFEGTSSKWHALENMGRSMSAPVSAEGLVFQKLMGTGGGNGFSIFPDFSHYAWLAVWQHERDALRFFDRDSHWHRLSGRSSSVFGWDAVPLRGHGTWNGKQPFIFTENRDQWQGPVAVITRASIRRSQTLRFWWRVPAASRAFPLHQGLLYAKGVGELPLVEQATVSLWENIQFLQQFAYKREEHVRVIAETRKYDWYSEEMFIRTGVVKIIGELPKIHSGKEMV